MSNAVRYGIAAVVLFIAVAIVVAFSLTNGGGSGVNPLASSPSQPAVTVKGYYGGEKSNFLKNPRVVEILKDRYGITVDGRKAGSTEMVNSIPLTPQDDFIWPSNMVSLAIYKEKGGTIAGSANIFNSPLVLYTHEPIRQALETQGIVQKIDNTYYVVDMAKLVSMVADKTKWKDIGLPQLSGSVQIRTTDPNFSNSGFMFAGLLASIINDGELPDGTTIQPHLATLQDFFKKLGFMEQSSSDLFQQYLTTGMGGKPIVAGYESQLIEFKLERPDLADQLGKYVALYPMPTVWSSHPLIARTGNGKRLLEALKDPEIQKIAWTQHGFRSGLGATSDPAAVGIASIPQDITAVVDMPSPEVMEKILDTLAGK